MKLRGKMNNTVAARIRTHAKRSLWIMDFGLNHYAIPTTAAGVLLNVYQLKSVFMRPNELSVLDSFLITKTLISN